MQVWLHHCRFFGLTFFFKFLHMVWRLTSVSEKVIVSNKEKILIMYSLEYRCSLITSTIGIDSRLRDAPHTHHTTIRKNKLGVYIFLLFLYVIRFQWKPNGSCRRVAFAVSKYSSSILCLLAAEEARSMCGRGREREIVGDGKNDDRSYRRDSISIIWSAVWSEVLHVYRCMRLTCSDQRSKSEGGKSIGILSVAGVADRPHTSVRRLITRFINKLRQ